MRPVLLPVAMILTMPALLEAQDAGADAAQRIRSALSAAPEAVAQGATVSEADGTVLREGTNGWVCMPDLPDVPNNAPMCVDQVWLEVLTAWQERREPNVDGVGISYMLQGDMPVSNVDPFAEGPTADNEWIPSGPPHIMVVVPDPAQLEGISTDPNNGGPWVMWKGTPYAHLMIPTVPRR